jgi:SNF2 family DNA or RNA helicase
MSARLPDGGAQLKTQRRQIIARMNSIKNPTSLSGPISEEKAQKCKQAMMNKQMSVLTSGAVEQLYKTMESCPGADSTASDPPGLKVSLFPHQKQGLAWAQWRERQRPAGGILADEMGLGKTLTMLSLVVSSLNTDRTRSQPPAKGSVAAGLVRSSGTLIVCPKSLMLQWDSEITKRFENGLLRSHVHHGSSRTTDPKRSVQEHTHTEPYTHFFVFVLLSSADWLILMWSSQPTT